MFRSSGWNDLYSWTGHGSGTKATGINGLNQIAARDGTAFAYDGDYGDSLLTRPL